MKALTISQPFASLIATGEKWVENRRWGTQYRGPLAIHAGKGTQYLDREELEAHPTGCIVATATLVGCMPLASMRKLQPTQRIWNSALLTIGDVLEHVHTEGPWCWILQDINRFETPVPCRGSQGLWDWQEPQQETRR